MGLRLPFLSIPRQPAFAASPQPVFSMRTSVLPGEDSSGVGPRIEELSGLRVPAFPANKTVAERRPTARCQCVVCATLHGICVFPCIFSHPHSPTHRRAFVFSRSPFEGRANAHVQIKLRVEPSHAAGKQTGTPRALRFLEQNGRGRARRRACPVRRVAAPR